MLVVIDVYSRLSTTIVFTRLDFICVPSYNVHAKDVRGRLDEVIKSANAHDGNSYVADWSSVYSARS
jgi:hypothetical protein